MESIDTLNFSELRDAEIVARMRRCNYEKFKSLVRMHLSFELDLNTDEFDLPCHEIVYEDKGKVRKWNPMSKKHKHGAVVAALASGSTGCASAVGIKGSNGTAHNANCGGSPTENLRQHVDPGFLFHLQELKDFLMSEKSIQQEGIFRKTGSSSRQNELRQQIQNDKPLDLEASGYSAHDCATVFKGYLAELAEPLLTDAHYPAHLQIAPLCLGLNLQMDNSNSDTNEEKIKKEIHVLHSIQLLLLLLPDENRQLLQHITDILHAVALKQDINKMGPDNLATLFAPHLICPRNLPPEALHYLARKMSSIISYMIIRAHDIFAVPAKLATDIRAYFLERKRKKTMSPEMTLDESISDVSTVNTVYTFVDREKTAAAHTTNTTDTELAQLYAHIQSMPESSKKRRLIKQFNKQNGQGTPLQLQAMNRLKTTDNSRSSSKSLSDSIKKHIFNKGLISRTPKRQPPVPSVVLETPNSSSMKYHKQRVLFQSPNPSVISAASSSTSSIISSSTTTSTSSWSMTNSTNSVNLTPYIIKSHPLQKSISSSSLLMSQPQQQHLHHYQITAEDQESNSSSSCSNPSACGSTTNTNSLLNTNSSDGFVHKTKSVSAPVSRQTSSDLQYHANTSITSTTSSLSSGVSGNPMDPTCCVTPLKLISEAAKHLIAGADKKSVAWDDSHLIDIERISNPSTPIQQTPSNDLKSRYKSEPNLSLSHNICETPSSSTSIAHDMITPITKLMPGTYIKRKLMKGVSMGNLKFPFSTPESTKRLVRTVSSSLKRRSSDDSQIFQQIEGSFASASRADNAPLLQDMDDEDLDDDTFEDDPADDCGAASSDTENGHHPAIVGSNEYSHGAGSSSSELPNFTGGSATYQQLLLQQSGIYRNLDLITSTPSLLLGRRSMSPITKSTQRMPKAMQESIMTPRSRKPVMVLTTTTSSTDQNQTINQTVDMLGCHEEDLEDDDADEDEDHGDDDDEDVGLEEEDEHLDGDHIDDDSILCGVATKTKPLDVDSNPPHPEVINEDATSLGGYSDILKRQQLLQANHSFVMQHKNACVQEFHSEESSSASPSNSCKSKQRKDYQQQQQLEQQAADVLSTHFKEYLLTRSVLTAPPEDTSFTSQSDDFESSRELDDIDENRLSSSLLYCLDGNRPECDEHADDDNDETTTETNDNVEIEHNTNDAISLDNNDQRIKEDCNLRAGMLCKKQEESDTDSSNITHLPLGGNRLANNPFVILNNARKRAATNDIEKMSSILFNSQQREQETNSSSYQSFKASSSSDQTNKKLLNKFKANKENCEQNDNYVTNKKLIISEYPGETSF
ncbi:serine-rich adhesin for platelets [Musca domestica]|uniref:Serine-rich adhesin for platelets n=1 Tax=Musca domestica TaxID=7370 RepID=A0ABM3V579_MUSDO|nr:serine-rich adhesin for platelets [Musca domestica]